MTWPFTQTLLQVHERTKLYNLIQQICTPLIQKKILNDYNSVNLSSNQIPNLKILSDHIYSFRCSLVHAKEEDINKTNIPDIFGTVDYSVFTSIVELLAKYSINKFNVQKGTS